MKQLFEIDTRDYDGCSKVFRRPSARGIIVNDGKLALVYSRKEKYYKFPGGGIKSGEDPKNALIREVGEEVGLTVIPESIAEFGSVMRRHKSLSEADTVFEQENFYYVCAVEDEIAEQHLDDYEKEAEFTLQFTDIDEAIRVNDAYSSENLFDHIMIKRELRVLQIIREAIIVQQLLPYAYVMNEGLDADGVYAGAYADALDMLLEMHPENKFLNELEAVSGAKESAEYILHHSGCGIVAPDDLGKSLIKLLIPVYENADISAFSKGMFDLWNKLPNGIKDRELFIKLCFANDPLLSCGDEQQTRKMYEELLQYYY